MAGPVSLALPFAPLVVPASQDEFDGSDGYVGSSVATLVRERRVAPVAYEGSRRAATVMSKVRSPDFHHHRAWRERIGRRQRTMRLAGRRLPSWPSCCSTTGGRCMAVMVPCKVRTLSLLLVLAPRGAAAAEIGSGSCTCARPLHTRPRPPVPRCGSLP